MAFYICMWNDEIIDHLAQHDVTPDDFEAVRADPDEEVESDSSGLPAVIGYAADGRRLFCVYNPIDETYIEPVTAYEIGE